MEDVVVCLCEPVASCLLSFPVVLYSCVCLTVVLYSCGCLTVVFACI